MVSIICCVPFLYISFDNKFLLIGSVSFHRIMSVSNLSVISCMFVWYFLIVFMCTNMFYSVSRIVSISCIICVSCYVFGPHVVSAFCMFGSGVTYGLCSYKLHAASVKICSFFLAHANHFLMLITFCSRLIFLLYFCFIIYRSFDDSLSLFIIIHFCFINFCSVMGSTNCE